MTMTMRTIFIALVLCAACGGGEEPTTTGNADLAFGVTNGVRNNTGLVDPLVGTIYGQVFLSSEVTLTGPIDGAQELGNVEVSGVDLEAATAAGAWTSPELEPQMYTFLGFFDVDGNGASSRSPDAGDPVTLPISNQFTIVAGEAVELTAMFDLVYN